MKLFSGWIWLLFAVAISLVVVSWAYFYHYRPKMAYAADVNAYTEKLSTEANKLNATKKKLEKAKQDVQAKAQQWQSVVAVKTPPPALPEGVNMAVTPYQLTVDARKFRNSVQRAVARQLRKGGVTVISGPEVPFPTDDPTTIVADYFNYPAARFPVCVFQLGTVTVEGSFEQIANHMAAWSDMPNYLAVASGLSLQGTSPKLTGTYSLTVIAFVRGKQMPPAPPSGGGAAAGGAAGSFGPPAGFGPPGGFGGPGGPSGGSSAFRPGGPMGRAN